MTPLKKKSKRFNFHRSLLCSRHDPTREAQREFQRRKPYCGAAPRPNARCSSSTPHGSSTARVPTPHALLRPCAPPQRTLFTFHHSLRCSRRDELPTPQPCCDPARRPAARRPRAPTERAPTPATSADALIPPHCFLMEASGENAFPTKLF